MIGTENLSLQGQVLSTSGIAKRRYTQEELDKGSSIAGAVAASVAICDGDAEDKPDDADQRPSKKRK
jgi:hypothetical protein